MQAKIFHNGPLYLKNKMSDKTEIPDKPDKLDKFLAGEDITLNCLRSEQYFQSNDI